MATAYRDNSRNGFRAQVFVRGKLRKLWLGAITASGAKIVCNHLDALKVAAETATPCSVDSLRWARAAGPRIQNQLASWGLMELGSCTNLPRTLGDYADHYKLQVAGAASTQKRWANVVKKLKDQLAPQTSLSAVSRGDAERISKAIRAAHADSHAGKLLGDFKQLFQSAVNDRLIAENPFEMIDTSGKHDKSRECYVDKATIDALLEHSDSYFRCLIVLARYGGMRVPSEPLSLEWNHVDLPAGKMQIKSPKTGFRVCPIFPEVKSELEVMWELADEGAKNVFTRARSSAATVWRDKLLAICQAASIKPWPKLWQNLRASARTDLESRFPGFVCDAWLGHSSKIAAKHYSRVNEEHFKLATQTEPIKIETGKRKNRTKRGKTVG